MAKYVNDTAAGKSVSAYIVMKGSKHIATITASYSNSGNMLLNVRQWGESVIRSYNTAHGTKLKTKPEQYENYAAYRDATDVCEDFNFQYATRGGGGYDKFAAALAGMIIDGHKMADHCGMRLPEPKTNNGLFPRDFKAPKGYTLANFQQVNVAGKRITEQSFIDQANKNLGFSAEKMIFTDEQHFDVIKERRRLYGEWQKSDDCIAGYSSCFRDSGLEYLKAFGYTVIRAI